MPLKEKRMREELTYGYFLTETDWNNSKELLSFQLETRKIRGDYLLPYFNTLNMVYLDDEFKNNKDCLLTSYFTNYV
ncbi:MAG: hypothetical protein KDK71_10765, partial [Chlamydiia bacterium]|nr:hypothetical protein [Chlamydiia bacterium]